MYKYGGFFIIIYNKKLYLNIFIFMNYMVII